MGHPIEYKAGHNFGNVTYLQDIGRVDGRRTCLFECHCGKHFVYFIAGVKHGKIVQCPECAHEAKVARNIARSTHGMYKTPEYRLWASMIARCHCPGEGPYKDYGAKGISVCQRWRDSFEAFYEDMGPRPTPDHTLERPAVKGDYGPGNCVWLLSALQQRNKNNTVRITLNGVTKNLFEWSQETVIPVKTLRGRVQYKWTPERMLTNPKRSKDYPGTTLLYKSVSQFTKDGKWMRDFDSVKKAQAEVGSSNIGSCCKGILKTSAGFIWKYKSPEIRFAFGLVA